MPGTAPLSPVSRLKTAYVSAFHLVPNVIVDIGRNTPGSAIFALLSEDGAVVDGHPPVFGPPTPISTVVAWRDRIGTKYRPQLGKELYWNESSDFLRAWPVGFDFVLGVVAAALDQRDTATLARIVEVSPSPKEMGPLLDLARRRGFSGRFPQILLGQTFWLPFRPTLVIEEPDWRGRLQRFGSVQGLSDELADLRETLVRLQPDLPGVTGDVVNAWRLPVTAHAWIVSGALEEACSSARSRGLPLWFRGI